MLAFDECRLMVDQSINAHSEVPRQGDIYLYPGDITEYHRQVRASRLEIPDLETTYLRPDRILDRRSGRQPVVDRARCIGGRRRGNCDGKKKPAAVIIVFIVLYSISYGWVRTTHSEVWERDTNSYVIFPSAAVYYIFRPATYIDGAMTGMRFHIGPHR